MWDNRRRLSIVQRSAKFRGRPEEIKKPGLIGAGLDSGVANNG
jgi:hypothetical protein